MWVGSEINPLCASANEESDPLVNNAPLTEEATGEEWAVERRWYDMSVEFLNYILLLIAGQVSWHSIGFTFTTFYTDSKLLACSF